MKLTLLCTICLVCCASALRGDDVVPHDDIMLSPDAVVPESMGAAHGDLVETEEVEDDAAVDVLDEPVDGDVAVCDKGGDCELFDPPVVHIGTTRFTGMLMGRSDLPGRGVAKAFRGIRYATAERFRPPLPFLHSDHVNATEYGSKCPQMTSPSANEDCLFLNVYTPINTQANDNIPVMVWVHGGGNKFGSGMDNDGTFLAAKGVVVVTLNYRLGIFGQFSSEELNQEYGSTGGMNYLLDQVEAFRWVQAHIRDFGGDPLKVTIFGQSAGGYSVCSHLVSPFSEGLFHQAVVESGGCTGPRGFHPKKYGLTKSAACMESLGCSDVACLRTLPKWKLIFGPKCSFQPSVDGKVLSDRPVDLLKKGVINLPMGKGAIFGFTSADGLVGAPYFSPIRGIAGMLTKQALLTLNKKSYEEHVQFYFPQRFEKLLELYPSSDEDSANSKSLITMNADACFKCPMVELARAVSKVQMHPTFLYEFSFYNWNKPKEGQFKDMSPHVGELPMVFADEKYATNAGLPYSNQLAEVMSNTWASFAKHGYPANPKLPVWPEFDTNGEQYMVDFNMPKTKAFSMKKDILFERCAVWGDALTGTISEKRAYEFCYNKQDNFVSDHEGDEGNEYSAKDEIDEGSKGQ